MNIYDNNGKDFNAFGIGDNFPQFNKEYNIKDIIKLDAINNLKKAIKKYGLERAEDIIKEVYTNPKTRDYLLKVLYEIWKG